MDVDGVSGNKRLKKNIFGSDTYDGLLKVWSQSLAAMKEKDLAKVERYKSHSIETASSTCLK